MSDRQDGEGWASWGKHVLNELQRNHDDHGELFRQLRKIEMELVTLKVKAAMAGAIAGAALSVISGLIVWAVTK